MESNKRTNKMRRPSQSGPEHRRASWARKERTYKTYIDRPSVRSRPPGDYGMDNFSFVEEHEPQWQLPPELAKRLPSVLQEHLAPFTQAGAAIISALERIHILEEEAADRADPVTTHAHLLSRRTSDHTPTTVGTEASKFNHIAAPTPSYTPSSSFQSRKPRHMESPPQLPVNMMGLESPPFTPVDSKAFNTPASEPLNGPKGTPPDLDSVTAHLTSSKNRLTTPLSPDVVVKNEKAWETYVSEFNAEVQDLRSDAMMRLKGYARLIDGACAELALASRLTAEEKEGLGLGEFEGDLTAEEKAALDEFAEWWSGMKAKVEDYGLKVNMLEPKIIASRADIEEMKPIVPGLV